LRTSATGPLVGDPCLTGAECDDGDICTAEDICDGAGVCAGTDYETILCASDDDCFESLCDSESGYCFCADKPTLCLTPNRTACYEKDDLVQVNIELGYGLHSIAGGQFAISYDPAVLRFMSLAPGDTVQVGPPFVDSPFGVEIYRIVDEIEGTLFYAVGADYSARAAGTHGPAVMATIRFRALAPCSSTDICFLDHDPLNTLLTNDSGSRVYHIPCCAEDISVRGEPVALDARESVTVNADAGTLSADVTWDLVTFTGGCGEQVDLDCTGTHSAGVPINHLASMGGRFPVGKSTLECAATDVTCGDRTTSNWNVTVRERHQVEIDVQLSPTMSPGPLERCIEFELFTSCFEESVIVTRTLNFGFPFNLPGQTRDVTFTIPAGQYGCVTARDPMHTLRSAAEVEISGTVFAAMFEDDPAFRGNWLISGNLDGNHTIDVVDHGIWYVQNGTAGGDGSSCASPNRDADINGDGVVDVLDRDFIDRNWLREETETCCSDGTGSPPPGPITEISLRDLQRMGLGDLSEADLNSDGMLDLVDVELYHQGASKRPPKAVRLGGHP
jgi:hypothetical protein